MEGILAERGIRVGYETVRQWYLKFSSRGVKRDGCYFDTDGSPIAIGGEPWRTKGQQPKAYQTPYGEMSIERHAYQLSGAGEDVLSAEREARLVVTSTPRFAKQSWVKTISTNVIAKPSRDGSRDD